MASAPTNPIRMKLDAAMLHPRGQEGYACESTSPEMLLPPMVLDTLLANYAFFQQYDAHWRPRGAKTIPLCSSYKICACMPRQGRHGDSSGGTSGGAGSVSISAAGRIVARQEAPHSQEKHLFKHPQRRPSRRACNGLLTE